MNYVLLMLHPTKEPSETLEEAKLESDGLMFGGRAFKAAQKLDFYHGMAHHFTSYVLSWCDSLLLSRHVLSTERES